MRYEPRIGVIGSGASAVCLLDAIAQEPDLPTGAIIVFEAGRYLWRGRPYQPDFDVVRVNAVPEDMSVRAGDIGHLDRWLVERELAIGTKATFTDPISGAQFIPRAVFGDYLEQSARAALMTLLRRGWKVELVRQQVESAEPTSAGLILRTVRGAQVEVDYAVLSVGAGSPADPYALTGANGFVKDPYPTALSLAPIDDTDDVAVIGSGLTAVDAVLSLTYLGHRGRIRLFSRSGVLPGVRQRPVQHVLRHFTPSRFRAMAAKAEPVTVADLAAIMDTELSDAGERIATIRDEIEGVHNEDPVARLRRQLGEVDSPSIALRILQQAVPEAGPDVWPLLAEPEKDRVLATHSRALMSLCCPMPPRSAATLLSLIESGRVEVVPDLRGVEVAGDGFVIETGHGSYRSSVAVNAINARQRKMSESASSLITSLVAAGLAEPHPRGGLHVERASSRLTVGSRPDSRLYALGDPAVGSLFFTFGVQSLVDRAVDIVQSIRTDSVAWSRRRARTELTQIPV